MQLEPQTTPEISMSKSQKEDVNRHIGARIRKRRIDLGWTQGDVAEALKITFQSAHKHEAGLVRVLGSRLYHLAKIFDVEVGYFFEGLDEGTPVSLPDRPRLALELNRNFSRMEGREQEAVVGLTRSLTRVD